VIFFGGFNCLLKWTGLVDGVVFNPLAESFFFRNLKRYEVQFCYISVQICSISVRNTVKLCISFFSLHYVEPNNMSAFLLTGVPTVYFLASMDCSHEIFCPI